MSKNIVEKIWSKHVVRSQEGYPDILGIDLHLVHEVTSPQAFDVLRQRGLRVHALERTLATLDHNVSTTPDREQLPNPISRRQIQALRKNCKEFGVQLMDMGSGHQGIVHVIGPELGITQPGMTIVCGDSHTSTHGAFGALAFGIGTTEVGHVLATGCMFQKRLKTMRVHFTGTPGKAIVSKDLILKLIGQIGFSGAAGYVLEYTGEAIRNLSMEARMTICNMSIECGARAGLISPDDTTFAYLEGRKGVPKGAQFKEAVGHWRKFASDEKAPYDAEVRVEISELSPVVTWGTNPGQSVGVEEQIPDPSNLSEDEADLARRALAYMDLRPGQPVEGIPIDYVFIGSCVNARLDDLRAAATIMKDKRIHERVTAFVVPGSEMVRKAAIDEGLDRVFLEAGCEFRQPGCSMCLGMNEDKCPPGKRVASTSNRNFVGRQGPGARTHLMSPLMAAAAAVCGEITDVRRLIP